MKSTKNKYQKKGFDAPSYTVIPRNIMEASAATAIELGESDNSFTRMLMVAEEFIDAGLTPMFLLDAENMDVFVVAKETYNKKLH